MYDSRLPDQNQVTTYEYDALGRRVLTTTNAGASFAQTTLTVYDALGRVTRTIANYVPDARIPDPAVHSRTAFQHRPNNDQNLVTDTAYDELSLVKNQVDVQNYTTLYGYSNTGRLIKTVRNAN